MPCFARITRKAGVKMPDKVSLFEDAERIEFLLKKKLNVDTHQELHDVIDLMERQTATFEKLKEILNEVLEEVQEEKEKEEPEDAYPDRFKQLRKQYAEAMKVYG